MINKYTNKQRGLLAVIMAMVMVFAGAAFVAAEVDATTETTVDYYVGYDDEGQGFFDSIDLAITEAKSSENKDKVVNIYIKGEQTFKNGGYGKFSGSFKVLNFIGADLSAKITATDSEYEGGNFNYAENSALTFSKLILDRETELGFTGNAGWMAPYFSIGEFKQADFTECTFPNGVCIQNGVANFTNCTFKNDSNDVHGDEIWGHDDEYGLFVYRNTECTVTGSMFDGVRGIVMYGESSQKNVVLTLDNVTFTNKVTDSPAVVIENAKSVTLTGENTIPVAGLFGLYKMGDWNPDGTTIEGSTNFNCIALDGKSCGALVNDKVYVTLTDAINVVEDNDTIYLMYDTEEEVIIPEGVTLELNGHTAPNVQIVTGEEDEVIATDDVESINDLFDAGANSVEYSGENFNSKVTIPAGKELIVSSKTISGEIEISAGDGSAGILTVEGAQTNELTIMVNGVEVIVGKGVFAGTITYGSVPIELEANNSSSFTSTDADFKISGTVGNDITISGKTITFVDTLTINSGATLTVGATGDIKVDDGASVYLYGEITSTDGETIKVGENSIFKAFNGAEITGNVKVEPAAVDNDAVIDIAGAMSTMTINDDVVSSNTYSQMQNVVIAESLYLKNKTTTTILGSFIVNEGVTLTIEKGSTLKVDSLTAELIVNGEIIVEDGALLTVEYAKDVTVTGQISSEGTILIDSTVTIKEGGSIVVENEDSSAIFVEKGLTIEKGAELIVKSQMNITDVSNKGTVILDGAVLTSNSTVKMAASDAIVNVKSVIGTNSFTLTITDNGLMMYKDSKDPTKNQVVENDDDDNEVTINVVTQVGIKGLTITSLVTSKTVEKVTTYYNYFDVAGSINVVNETDSPANNEVDVDGPRIKVTENLTIGKNVKLDNDGSLIITGNVYAVAEESAIDNADGIITVDGLVQIVDDLKGKVNAALYESDVDNVTNYFYTSFISAVASGATEIDILGTIKVIDDVTVPAGVKIKNNGTMEVGDSKNRDVTVTFADGSELRNGIVTVNGTVVFDNKKNDKAQSITSDVIVEGDVSRMYTNLYTALANAKPGDVVTVNGDDIKIDADLTIPEGVTLDIISGKTMTINNDVTLTVDGTLRTASAVLAQTTFADEASENESCIIVNGTFMSMDDIEFTNYNIPGAYYNIVDASGNYDYVTPVEAVETVAQKVTNGVIDIYGENKVSDVTLAGTEDLGLEITIQTGADVDLSTMTLAYATLTITGTVNGTVESDAGSIEFVDVKSAVVTVDADADGTVMNIAGTLADGGDSNVKSKVTIANGTVTVAAALDVKNMEKHISISAGAELSVIKSGTFEAKQVTIDGELYVTDSGSVKITEKMTVLGTFEVAEADTEANTAAGNATIATMYVGMTSKQVTGEGATIIGKPTIEKLMYVDASATIPADLIKDKKFVEFYVEDALWMTVYDFSAIGNVEVKEIPVENVKLVTWTDKDGKRVTTSATNAAENYTVKIEDNKVYAKINYNVYLVKIWAAEGIDDVYIDGILVPGSALIGEYATQYVSAGTHTISYTLANGYTGSAQMVINDKLVSGYTFTAEGDYDDVEYIIKLQGIEKAPAEVGGGDAPSADKDEGMELTDILLIVLVVLIVIMAIIVALRMMRS